MALTKEDGTIVTGANTYVDVDDVETFCENRGLTTWTGSSDDDAKEQAILRAMDYIESRIFKGVKSYYTNPLQWPRNGVYDEEGYSIDVDEIPDKLKNGVMQAAYEEFVSSGCLQSTMDKDDFVTEKKIDVITTKYQKGKERTQYTKVLNFLQGFLEDRTRVRRV